MAFNPLEFKVPGQYEYQGICYGGNVKGVNIKMNDVWSAGPSDVLIASYPRTGTTWMGPLLPLIMAEGNEYKVQDMRTFMKRVPFLEFGIPGFPSALDQRSRGESPHIMKSHLRYEFFQKHIENEKMKVILMIRNPKDCHLSLYNLYKDMSILGHFPGTLHDFFEIVKAKRTIYGSYWDWCANWWIQRDQENILVVRYEDMVKDCIGVVLKVASFLQKDIGVMAAEQIVKLCSKENMQKEMSQEQVFSLQEWKQSKPAFIRKGGIGQWKNVLNEEESSMIEAWCKDKLSPLGLYFQYE